MKRIAILVILLFLSCTKTVVKKQTVVITDETVTKTDYPIAYIVKESVNLRSSGSVKSQIITTLIDGEKIELIKNRNGWYFVKSEGHKEGWIRSDMVGPPNMSKTLMAAAFVDSTLPNYNVKMFFDKKQLYKIVYLIFPESNYKNVQTLKSKAKKIGKEYQDKVYAGSVELRIMQPDEKTLFSKITLNALTKADIPSPVLNYGRLIDLYINPKDELTIKIAVADSIKDNSLLSMVRNISKIYDYRIKKIEILVGRDSEKSISFLENPKKEKKSTFCRLYYLEDDAGEYYKFNQCFE